MVEEAAIAGMRLLESITSQVVPSWVAASFWSTITIGEGEHDLGDALLQIRQRHEPGEPRSSHPTLHGPRAVARASPRS